MANTINCFHSSSDEEYWSEEDDRSCEPSASEKEVSPSTEVVPAKRARKVPAKFKDSACTPTTSKVVEEFDAMMKDSKYLKQET